MSRLSLFLPETKAGATAEGVNNKDTLWVQVEFNWLLSQHGFIACLHVISKQLAGWNAYLSLLGYNLVMLGFYHHFSLDLPIRWDRRTYILFNNFMV